MMQFTRIRRKRRDAGFTLPELAVAGGVSAFLMLAAYELLLTGATFQAEAESRIRLNQQARSSFETLMNGSIVNGGIGTDLTDEVQGVRGQTTVPGTALRNNYRLRLTDNGLQHDGDQVPSFTIPCTGVGTPLPDCTDASDTQTVTGWIATDPTLTDTIRSVDGRTVEAGITIVDPWQVQRPRSRPGQAIEEYRSIITRRSEGES
jgi:type II secretory pathway pseudopilin PulG